MPTLSFENGTEANAKPGEDFVQVFEKNHDLPLKFGCRRGECGVCAIKVIEGEENLTRKSKQETLTLQKKKLEGSEYRLACQCAINGDVKITPVCASARSCSESQDAP